jgi:type IV secretion system protein VirB6
MTDNVVVDIYNAFGQALAGFHEGAAQGLSNFLVPLAWILLGIAMLVWCFLVIEGKVAAPMTDWLFRFVGFCVVLYLMGSGYAGWISAPGLIGQVNDKVVDLVSAMFTAASKLTQEFAFGPAITLLVMAVLVVVAVYLLLAGALFSIIYSKLGLSLVLAVGPLFVLALFAPQSRSYFHAWLNTALYFVLYHLLSVLFIFLFLGVIDGYVTKLNGVLAGVGGGSVLSMVTQLLGMSANGLNVAAVCVPILLVSLAMFFAFLQIPTLCASLTGGSGGSFNGAPAGRAGARLLLARRRESRGASR